MLYDFREKSVSLSLSFLSSSCYQMVLKSDMILIYGDKNVHYGQWHYKNITKAELEWILFSTFKYRRIQKLKLLQTSKFIPTVFSAISYLHFISCYFLHSHKHKCTWKVNTPNLYCTTVE